MIVAPPSLSVTYSHILRRFALLVSGLAWLTLAAPGSAEELRLEPRGVEGSELVVDVVGSNLHQVGGFDLTVRFDPGQLGAPTRANGPLAAGTMFADNGRRPGEYRLALLSPTGVSGAGEIATLRFPLRGEGGATALQLDAALVDVHGVPIEARAQGTQVAAMPARELSQPAEASEGEALAAGEAESTPDVAAGAEAGEAEPGEAAEAESMTDEAASEPGASESAVVESDPDEAPLSPEEERRRRDRAARMAGYQLRVIFDPSDQLVQRPRSELRAEITVFHHGRRIPASSGDLSISTRGAEVERMSFPDDGAAPSAIAELRVDPEALPAEIDVEGFDLYGRFRLPVHPEIDPDLDHSGTLDDNDIAIIEEAMGSRKGSDRYAEPLDLVPDGVIDGSDLAAFRFNLIKQERARRLRALDEAEAVLEE